MNANRVSFRKKLGMAAWYVGLIGLALPFLYPFWWMITSAFKTVNEIFAFPPTLLPSTWHWENFGEVFTFQPFAQHYVNSLYIAILVTAGTLLVSSLAGYAFARIQFRGASLFFILLLSGMMMPNEVTIIPNFITMKTLGWTNTHLPLILIPILGMGGVLGTFMMRQYFLNLPQDLEDAAMMDGLNRFGIYWRIALPIARPALTSVAILTFLSSWNAFLDPLIYLDDLTLFTIPLSLRGFTDQYGTPLWNVQLAATTLAVLPVLIFYVVAQRQVVESFSLSGSKG
ncbi:MAG: carbohydrate ABC transporter permease [Anaerolineae bacterium]|nr:carbohydrate ABC transporter permease [Anaerolineae bacterium]